MRKLAVLLVAGLLFFSCTSYDFGALFANIAITDPAFEKLTASFKKQIIKKGAEDDVAATVESPTLS